MKNISQEEMERHISHVEKIDRTIICNGEEHKIPDQKFVYFKPKKESIGVYVGEYKIPLSLDNYGFLDSRIVKLNKSYDGGLKFSESMKEEYNSLFENDKISLNIALETIAKCVNNSIRFDIEGLSKKFHDQGCTWCSGFSEEFLRLAKDSYKPFGDETLVGICSDAGRIIRSLISKNIEENIIQYTHISAQSKLSTHDTTLILDTREGIWAVVNSKSPLKKYNLVPKEQLQELGSPYYLFGPSKSK